MSRAGHERTGSSILNLPVAAGQKITEGTMVVLNADGYAEEASADTGLRIAGVSQVYVDNRVGADGDEVVEARRGAFVFDNDGSIETTDILQECYIKDATTVSKTAADTSVAGLILAVEPDGITIEIK